VRRKKFLQRIDITRRQIKDTIARADSFNCIKENITKTLEDGMGTLQSLQNEHERVLQSEAKFYDCSVLHGQLQRFKRLDLLKLLSVECEKQNSIVGNMKQDMLAIENKIAENLKRLKTLESLQRSRERALLEFDKKINEQRRGHASKQNEIDEALLKQIFGVWKSHSTIKSLRNAALEKLLRIMESYQLRSAFPIWVRYRPFEPAPIISQGGYLLNKNYREKLAFEQECHSLVQQVYKGSANYSCTMTPKTLWLAQRQMTPEESRSQRFQYWRQGEFSRNVRDFDGAEYSYKKHLKLVKDSLIDQGRCYYSLGLLSMERYDENSALVSFEKALSLSRQVSDLVCEAQVSFGLGHLLMRLQKPNEGIKHLLDAKNNFEILGEHFMVKVTLQSLANAHERDQSDLHARYLGEAEQMTGPTWDNKLNFIKEQLNGYRTTLNQVKTCGSTSYSFERVGAVVLDLRRRRIEMRQKKIEIRHKQRVLSHLLHQKRVELEVGLNELNQALETNPSYVTSDTITGTKVRYPIRIFEESIRKMEAIVRTGEHLVEMELDKLEVDILNIDDEIGEIDLELDTETGPLMASVRAKIPFHNGTMNISNIALTNVLGDENAGSDICAISSHDSVFLYELCSGVCIAHIVGEGQYPTRSFEPRRGHRQPITSLHLRNKRLYTGGMDAALGVYSVENMQISILRFLTDPFQAPVKVVATSEKYFLAGCSNLSLLIFDDQSFQALCIIEEAHRGTVLSLEVCENKIASGAADGCIKIWCLEKKAKLKMVEAIFLPAAKKCSIDHSGHSGSVTSLSFLANELASGDSNGLVIVWNLETKMPLRSINAHDCSVTALQLMGGVVISGGSDGDMALSDLSSGKVFGRCCGHHSQILDLQYDQQNLLSLSRDGTVRLWHLNTLKDEGDESTHHMVRQNESIQSIALQLKVGVSQLLAANNLASGNDIFLGQRLEIPRKRVAQYKVSRTLGNLKNELRLDQVELDERSKDLKNEITLEDKVLIANYVNCFFLNHDD